MEIRTKYNIKRMKIGELEIMKAYIIYDEETHENRLIITDTDHQATVIRRCSNDPSLCILSMGPDTEVNVIGEVDDFDIVNVKYREPYGER